MLSMLRKRSRRMHTGSAALALCLAAAPACAEPQSNGTLRVHTGGESGAYHLNFCPPLAKALAEKGHDYQCTASSGSLDNMRRVAETPGDFGFAQLDVFTLERGQFESGRAFQTVRISLAFPLSFSLSTFRISSGKISTPEKVESGINR